MTAIAAPLRRPGFADLLRAEWTKIRSIRSTVWSLVIMVVAIIGFTVLITSLTAAQWSNASAASRADIVADPVSSILGAGLFLGQLAICVLGVMVMSSEYSTGVIRSSLLAVPRRLRMLAAKAVVFAALVFVIAVIAAFISFFLGAAILHSHAPVSLSDPGVARAVLGEALYLTVLGLFAMAVGGLLRHTAGAVTAVIGLVLVVGPLAQLIPGTVGKHIYDYLPSTAGLMITQASQKTDQLLSPWQGFGVFCLWTALLFAACGYFLVHRDALFQSLLDDRQDVARRVLEPRDVRAAAAVDAPLVLLYAVVALEAHAALREFVHRCLDVTDREVQDGERRRLVSAALRVDDRVPAAAEVQGEDAVALGRAQPERLAVELLRARHVIDRESAECLAICQHGDSSPRSLR
jgi:ABC-type transport system involved in multi-copper enzyme maturation permease subunit